MADREERQGNEPEEVEASRGLTIAEDARIPGKTRGDRGRHGDPREDHERSYKEDDAKVGELLKWIIGVAVRWKLEAEVGERRARGGREDVPSRGDEPAPLARGEEERCI